MKNLARFLVGLFMPLILIGGGGALLGYAITIEVTFLAWVGLAMIGAGVLWGLVLFFWASGGDW